MIQDIQNMWADTPAGHQSVNNTILATMPDDLHALRDYIEKCSYGYGERVMYGMWKILLESLDKNVKYLEIGVHRGATLALMGHLACTHKYPVDIYGISPMNGHPDYIKRDYHKDLRDLWDYFNIKTPYRIFEGLSSDPELVTAACAEIGVQQVDMLYIDGSHDYKDVLMDICIYVRGFLKPGGYLVMDDSACDLRLPSNWFAGHQSVTNALNYFLKTSPEELEFLFSVSHNKVYRKR